MKTPEAKEYSDIEFRDYLVELVGEFNILADLEAKFISQGHFTAMSLTQAQLRLVEAQGWVLNAVGLLNQMLLAQKASGAKISTVGKKK